MSRKKTTVGTSISRVIPDDKLPDLGKTGITKALFGNGDIHDYLVEEAIGSIGMRAEKAYAYAKRSYHWGLPSGQFLTGVEDIDAVVAATLVGIEGAAVDVDYLRYGAPNNLHIGWIKLMALHGYNPATNQLAALTAIKGTPVYLHDMVVVVPNSQLTTIETQSLELWGIAAKAGPTPQRINVGADTASQVLPTGVQVDMVGSTEFIRVEYVYESATVPSGVIQESFTIPITGYDSQADYFHARYRVGGVVKYWMYRDGDGTYVDLDALFDVPPQANGTFFPFAYFRYDKVSENSNTASAAYLTSKKYVSYLGLDYDSLADGINSNPGIADVEQAMLMMAVPANTTNLLERRYLWEFFNKLWLASDPAFRYRTEEQAALHVKEQERLGLVTPGIMIQDTRFKMSLDNMGIYKRRKAGSIGPVGAHNSSFSTANASYTVGPSTDGGEDVTVLVPVNSHYYRRQISVGFYDEIQVVNLRTVFYILGDNTAIGDDEDTILIVPLDRSITRYYSLPDRELLYSRGMHFVFNSAIVTKVKWYQTGLFQALLLVAAVVITVLTYGETFELVMLALGAGEIAIAAWLTLQILVPMLLTKLAFKLFVKELGAKSAFAIAIIAIAAAVIVGGQSGSIPGMPTAMDLLQLANGLNSAVSLQIRSDMQDLLSTASLIGNTQKEELELLEAGKKLLENRTMLSPFVIFGEPPSRYIERSLYGNIGVLGIEAVSAYVGHALKLPELIDTLGDTA